VTGTYTQDGVAKIDWGRGADEGSWRIIGGKFCTKYPKVRNGVETCFTVYKTGENEYKSILPDGSLNATGSFTN
jgi:hypothetical protein